MSPFANAPTFFDFKHFEAEITKKPIIPTVKQAISDATEILNHRFATGESIRCLITERSLFFDYLLNSIWIKQGLLECPLSLIAVGGYGRGELHPESDIDILILTEPDIDAFSSEKIADFVTLLWDVGIKVGHAVRSIEQSTSLAREDVTIITNLLESRTLAGDPRRLQTLKQATSVENMWDPQSYFRAKISEQEARHDRSINNEFNLEPNVKNAPGGLRDIQTISWVAKRNFGTGSLISLHKLKFLTDSEFSLLTDGEEFLWKVRYGIHILSKRPEERLLVDIQRELAEMFGYVDTAKSLGVEQFMKRYYRWVQTLSQLNEVLLQYLRESILPSSECKKVIKVNRRFEIEDGYISTTHSQVFARSPSAILELFAVMGNTEYVEGVRASTIRQIRSHLHLIDDRFRGNIGNTSLFMEIMRSRYHLTRILRRMVRYGVLGKYLPEFDKITGLMQHDLFHKYTVDAHTLILVKYLRKFYKGEFSEEFPVATRVAGRLPKPELLFIAGLYHDIAKGRGGNHAQLGAIDARAFCHRHNLGDWDTELVAWLVDKHLLMSGVSQKQDLSDPDVIERFAVKVKDQTYLDYLFCLTVADINATNPELWNSWKALLLRQLYHSTSKVLARGDKNPETSTMWINDTKQAALTALTSLGFNKLRVERSWEKFNDAYFLREQSDDVVWHTQEMLNNPGAETLVLIRDHSDQQAVSATQIFVRTSDRPRVFSTITNTLSSLGLHIYDARIFATDDGYTADTFMVLDSNKQTIGDNEAILETIKSALITSLGASCLPHQTKISGGTRVQKYFNIETTVNASNTESDQYTQLDITAADRPGLLAAIGRVFDELGIKIHFARIITLGEKVEDSFYVTDMMNQPLTDNISDIEQSICHALDEFTEERNEP